MKEINELNIPEDIKYTDDHEWVKKDGEILTIGITDYAQDQLGEIVFVEVPEVDDSFDQGDEFGTVESVKAVSEMYMPIAGEVVEVNEALEDGPELVNTSCYDQGWIMKIKPQNPSDFEALLDKAAYLDILRG